jgi:hypothetical protein
VEEKNYLDRELTFVGIREAGGNERRKEEREGGRREKYV